jgi:hypothetical protein
MSIARAFGCFRAVPISDAEQTIRFDYRPRAVRLGGVASAVALLALLLVPWLCARRARLDALDRTPAPAPEPAA